MRAYVKLEELFQSKTKAFYEWHWQTSIDIKDVRERREKVSEIKTLWKLSLA